MDVRNRHPEKALSAVGIRNQNRPGRYADGNGLYLVVDASGAKRWVLRTVVNGRRRDIGLGSVRLVSLAEARERAATYRRVARDGGDPIAERRRATRTIPTFAEAAEKTHTEQEKSWKNEKHAAQWLSSLRDYVFPIIGDRRVDQVETPDVLRVLSPIWLTKPETARRVRQRIGTVLDWATAAGFRSGENPVRGVAKGLPKQPEKKDHFAAMPFKEVPAFVKRLRADGDMEPSRLAFELLILTATRTSEVLEARWDEVDLKAKLWKLPADRMKAGKEHRVPLAPRAIEILKRARAFAGDSHLVFPGRSPEKPMSNMVFLMTLRRMKVDATAHGFRSAFRDWAAEETSFPREVVEMALAHAIESKVEAAYRRGDLLDKRRELMEAWAIYLA